jgi:hypothetical protein
MKRTTSVRSLAFLFTALALATGACGSSPQSSASTAVLQQLPSNKATPPTTKEACDACNGLWDFHGIGDTETCICPTSDAGKSCTDGQQCEGACIVTDDDFEVIESGGDVPKGYYVGHCADYDTTFGCYRDVPPGTLEHGPHAKDEGIEDVCVD